MRDHFQTLLEGIVADPDQRISALPLLSEAERCQLFVDWNDTATDFPSEHCIHELFDAHVAQRPEAIALTFEGQSLRYLQRHRLPTRAIMRSPNGGSPPHPGWGSHRGAPARGSWRSGAC